eukprot:NODE_205_length_12934_cov_1.115933.p6 type:complete len:152 gc:universal NODE_205_length_12934_cov_1.115933:12041-11586(-)
MPLTVEEFFTTSINPISGPVERQPYGASLISNPSLCHIFSISLSICRVNMSCRRSSPLLYMIGISSPYLSKLSKTIHRGNFLESMTLHFLRLIPEQDNFGFNGNAKPESSFNPPSIFFRTLPRSAVRAFFTAKAVSSICFSKMFCLISSSI